MTGYFAGLSSPSVTLSKVTLQVLAEIESGRTHEITDVFDEQEIEAGQGQMVQCAMHEVCVEVTGSPGRDLYGRHTVGADASGVVVGLQVALDDRDAVAVAQRHDGGFQQGRLARARRGHEIDRQQAVLVEVLAVVRCNTIIGREQILEHFDG